MKGKPSVFPLETKEFTTHIILNYRSGKFRLLSKEPLSSQLNVYEIAVKYNLKVNIPEPKKIETTGEITLTDIKVDAMRTTEVAEAL